MMTDAPRVKGSLLGEHITIASCAKVVANGLRLTPQQLWQLSNIHSNAPRSSRVASGRALGKPHLSIVTRYQPSVFCKPETAIEAVSGPVASFEDIPKFIGDHGERHYSSPTLC